MGPAKLTFWGWDEAVLPRAVGVLMRGWQGSGALDLGETLVVVPTAESVRRLREALALAVGEAGGAVSAPHLWHPALAFQPRPGEWPVASPLQERAAWTQVLLESPLAELQALIPVPPQDQDLAWASAVAESLGAVRKALGAGGLGLRDAVEPLAVVDDPARWRELADLETTYLETLAKWMLRDAEGAKREAAMTPLLPEGVRRVLVFAVADAPPLFGHWLRQVQDLVETEIFVHAPESRRPQFDPQGMPLVSAWGDDAGVSCPVSHDRMHRVPGAEDQARLAKVLLQGLAGAGRAVALGACDPGLNSLLEGTLTAAGVRVYNPAGRSAKQHPVLQVLRCGWQAARSPAWRDWLPFLRMDDVIQAVCAEAGITAGGWLRGLDRLHEDHLPPTLAEALQFGQLCDACRPVVKVLEVAVARAELWHGTSCEEVVRNVLTWLYGAREFDANLPHQQHHGEIFGQIMRTAMQMDAALPEGQSPTAALGMVWEALGDLQLGDARGEADLVLHGWLELLWEPAPGLVVTGFNDEHVPGILAVDPFLPDRARQTLGLPCQATRRARDAYLFHAMAGQRAAERSLHVVLGRVTAEGDALRPSRLLLDAKDEELPGRVKHLFPADEHIHTAPRPTRSHAFVLVPPRRQWPARQPISPTSISRYLACPFRFYLSDVLKMRAVETGQRELSPMGMGDLSHKVLKRFADDMTIAASKDAAAIAQWLSDELDRQTLARYGASPLFSVILQIESLRQRLQAFAPLQAAARESGWSILAAEQKITDEWKVTLSGLSLRGTIDRVDCQEDTGKLRIIDYKTSSSTPEKAHWITAPAAALDDPEQAWKCFDAGDGKWKKWVNLQLPLYAMAATATGSPWPQSESVEAAYLSLPAAVSEVKWQLWGSLDDTALLAATQCAREAARRIQEGIFWPPSNRVQYDDFSGLFQGDPLDTVAPPDLWRDEETDTFSRGAGTMEVER